MKGGAADRDHHELCLCVRDAWQNREDMPMSRSATVARGSRTAVRMHARAIRMATSRSQCPYFALLMLACVAPDVAALQESQGVLRNIWLNYNEAPVLAHVQHYADHYETHLPPRGRNVKILEIGVQSGGSTRTWKQYYGKNLRYVGVDIDPRTARSRSPSENIEIEIGSQANATFLLEVCRRHGPFDVVIDDGGHTPAMITASLQAIFPSNECMATNSLYVVEDACTMMGSWYTKRPSEIYGIAGEAWWSMHGHTCKQKHYRPCCLRPNLDFDGKGAQTHPTFREYVTAVHLYESLAFFVRGVQQDTFAFTRGRDAIPYDRGRVSQEEKRAQKRFREQEQAKSSAASSSSSPSGAMGS